MFSKDVSILMLGLLVALTPFLGLPDSWKTVVLSIFGIAIAVLAFLLRGDMLEKSEHRVQRSTDVFVENGKPTRKKSSRLANQEFLDATAPAQTEEN